MTRARFAALAAAFGADPSRWPDAERAAALALLGRDPDAARLLDGERALDAALAGWRVEPPAPFLDARIAAAVLGRAAPLRRLRAWFAGGAAAATLAGGIAAGIVLAASVPQPPPSAGQDSMLYEATAFGTPLDAEPDGAAPAAPAPTPGAS